MDGEWPLVIGYYTVGNGYEVEAKRMMDSCKRFGLEYEVEPLPVTTWQKATCHKPTFLLERALAHPNRKLFYLDADAEILTTPEYLYSWDGEFAVPYVNWADYGKRPRKEVITAAILFHSTRKVWELLRSWIIKNIEHPSRRFGDQENLQDIIGPALEGEPCPYMANIERLPDRYSQIFDSMQGVEPPVIRQWQASRRLKTM